MNNKHLLPIVLFFPVLVACGKQVKVEEDAPERLMLTDSLRQVVSVDTVREVPLKNELLLNGRITFNAGNVARVYPMFGGTVTEVRVEAGDYVKKNDVLAVMRSAEAAGYEKQQKEARRQLSVANRNLDATRDMFRSGMASERDVLQAEQEAGNAEAECKRLEEVFSINHLTGNSTYEITSPVSGFVVSKDLSADRQIRPDQDDEIFLISSLDDVWVMADVYEGDISKVREGSGVRITTLAYGGDRVFTGVIDKVYNVLDEESKTMKVRVELNNKDYRLKPGMFANVYVQSKVDGQTMARIDAHAVIFEDGRQYVVCIGQDGCLHTQEISVYKQTEEYCYLQSGLKEGDRIINDNALLVYNALK